MGLGQSISSSINQFENLKRRQNRALRLIKSIPDEIEFLQIDFLKKSMNLWADQTFKNNDFTEEISEGTAVRQR